MTITIDSTFGPASRPPSLHEQATSAATPYVPLGNCAVYESSTAIIEYYSSGTGPVVVLLSALAQSVAEFNRLIAALNAHGYRTLAIQQSGVGRSRRVPGGTVTLLTLAAEIAAVLQHAGVPDSERVHLLGRGLGNRVARAFGSRYPDRTAGMILLAAGGKRKSIPALSIILKYQLLQLPGLPTTVRRGMLESILCHRRGVLPDGFCRRPPLRAILQQGRAARRTPLESWWSGGTAPVLILQGACDRVASPANAIEMKLQFPERVELVMIPDAGHALTFEAPDIIEDACLAFLRTQHSSTAHRTGGRVAQSDCQIDQAAPVLANASARTASLSGG